MTVQSGSHPDGRGAGSTGDDSIFCILNLKDVVVPLVRSAAAVYRWID